MGKLEFSNGPVGWNSKVTFSVELREPAEARLGLEMAIEMGYYGHYGNKQLTLIKPMQYTQTIHLLVNVFSLIYWASGLNFLFDMNDMCTNQKKTWAIVSKWISVIMVSLVKKIGINVIYRYTKKKAALLFSPIVTNTWGCDRSLF